MIMKKEDLFNRKKYLKAEDYKIKNKSFLSVLEISSQWFCVAKIKDCLSVQLFYRPNSNKHQLYLKKFLGLKILREKIKNEQEKMVCLPKRA